MASGGVYPVAYDYQVESRKWMNLIGVLWIQALGGTNFDFSGYSSSLKEVLQISQVQLNNLAVASDLGKLLGWISGYAMRRMRLWVVLLIATSLGLLGYGLQYLVLSKELSLNYSEVYVLCFLCGNSICWLNTVGFTLCIRNFPERKAMALGLSTSYNALTAAAFTVIAKAISVNSSALYLLLNAVLPILVCALVLTFIREIPSTKQDSSTERQIFIILNVIAVVLGIYLLPVDFLGLSRTLSYKIYAAGMVLLLLIPLGIPGIIQMRGLRMNKREDMGFEGYYSSIPEHDNTNHGNNGVSEKHECEELQDNVSQSANDNRGERIIELNFSDHVPGLGEEHNLLQLFRSVDFWLYFFMYLCGATIGLTYSNNLGQIVQSRGYSSSTVFVSLYSSSAFFGRLMSAGPDYFPRAASLGRPGWTCLAMVPMCPALFYLSLDNSVPLYVSTAIIGMCSGFIISSAVSITSELFGTNSFGVNHNILVANIPLGSLLFGYMAALIYDENGDSKFREKDEKLDGIMVMCMGVKCYRSTFLIWGCICLLGFIFNCILFVRTKSLYKSRNRTEEAKELLIQQ